MCDGLHSSLERLRSRPNDLKLAGRVIDQSAAERDLNAAQEALAVISSAHSDRSADGPGLSYMLGTAQSTVARLRPNAVSPEWTDQTWELRLQARANLFAATRGSDPDLATAAWTNLGHELSRTARLSESYECYARAYSAGKGHPVGAGWMAVTLSAFNDRTPDPDPGVVALAHHLALLAQQGEADVEEVALAGVSATFSRLPTERAADFQLEPVPAPDSYEAFVRDNRLYLTPAVDGVPISRWDDADVTPLYEPGGSVEIGPPPVVGMVNILKADYLEARRLAYSAFTDRTEDAHLFMDTGDGARYGAESARYRLALRASLDCLDRVGSAINSFWSLGVLPHKVHFHALFREHGELRAPIRAEFDQENWGMVALVDLADDLHSRASWLSSYRDWRNVATHRFLRTVPGADVDDADGPLTDISFDELSVGALAVLGIARSALLTLFGAIRHSSENSARGASGGGVIWRRRQRD